MTQTARAVVRKQIVVEAPVEKAFAVFTEGSATSSHPSTTCSASRSPRLCSSRAWVAISTTGAWTVASVDGHGSWYSIRPDRVVFSWDIGPTWQLETEPERSTSGSSPRTPSAPGSSSSIETSTGMVPVGGPSPRASATTRAGRCTWSVTRRCST